MPSKTLSLDTPKNGTARYQAAVAECITEIDRISKGMKRKQTRIDKLRSRTRARLAELKAML